jgi:hypothetical protein
MGRVRAVGIAAVAGLAVAGGWLGQPSPPQHYVYGREDGAAFDHLIATGSHSPEIIFYEFDVYDSRRCFGSLYVLLRMAPIEDVFIKDFLKSEEVHVPIVRVLARKKEHLFVVRRDDRWCFLGAEEPGPRSKDAGWRCLGGNCARSGDAGREGGALRDPHLIGASLHPAVPVRREVTAQ